jgi:hypothetical protein
MSRPARLFLAVAIAAAASGVLVAGLFALVRSAGPGPLARRGEAVVQLPEDRIVSLRISTPRGEARCVRESGRWTRVDPGPPVSATGAAAALLDALARLRRRATLAGPGASQERLRTYGLDEPRLRLELGLEGGGTLRVAIGDGTGADGAAFALSPEGEVVVVESGAAAEVVAAAERLVSSERLPAPGGPTRRRG